MAASTREQKVRPATDPAVPATAAPRRPFGEHSALGMAIFIFTEVMLFAGFFSAFVIVRKAVPEGAWPPPDQPQLPFERTAFNTLALLLSGVALFVAGRRFRRDGAGMSGGSVLGGLHRLTKENDR